MKKPVSPKIDKRNRVNTRGTEGCAVEHGGFTPSYRSYPSTRYFTERFCDEDVRQAIRATKQTSIAPLSVYVNIPFLEDVSHTGNTPQINPRHISPARTYLDHLQREIRLQAALFGARRPVTQFYVGGSVLTTLGNADLTHLVLMLSTSLNLIELDNREYSVDINPDTVNLETLALLKGLGFNRLVFRIPKTTTGSSSGSYLAQKAHHLAQLTEAARDHGFRSLTYSMPVEESGSPLPGINTTLDTLIELAPDRISYDCFSDSHVQPPNLLVFDHHVRLGTSERPMLKNKLIARLDDAGYEHLGMECFVRADDDLAVARNEGRLQRNLQGYTLSLAPDLVGLGVSAISGLPDCYVQNTSSVHHYYGCLEQDILPVVTGRYLNTNDLVQRFVIMSLICNLSVDTNAVYKEFGVPFFEFFSDKYQAVENLEENGLLTRHGSTLQVTTQGQRLLRKVCMAFDAYLTDH